MLNTQSRQHLLELYEFGYVLLQREITVVERNLHDDLGQVLTALRMQISLFKLQYQHDQAITGTADNLSALMDHCLQSMNSLFDELQFFNHGGDIALALRRICRRFERQYPLKCVLTVSDECQDLEEVMIIILLRIVYEALENVARHVGHCQVGVTYRHTANSGLDVLVSDNGPGFDIFDTAHQAGRGLKTMKECAFALGGQIEIASEKHKGTTVILRIPAEALGLL